MVLGSLVLLMSLVVSTIIPTAEARHSHAKEWKKQQQQGIEQTNSCNDNNITCINNNAATQIICEHATCIIGNITPFRVPSVY
jgi:hypothetical protein